MNWCGRKCQELGFGYFIFEIPRGIKVEIWRYWVIGLSENTRHQVKLKVHIKTKLFLDKYKTDISCYIFILIIIHYLSEILILLDVLFF